MTKEERVNVFNDTIDIVRKGKYKNRSGKIVTIVEDAIKEPISVNKPLNININEASKYDGEISVVNGDCLYVAEELAKQGKTCVLNMASFKHPGGGVWRGSAAQEENLFRRTNLFRSLYQYDDIDYVITHLDQPRKAVYPLHPDFGAIYSRGVTVLKKSDDAKYALLDEPFIIDVVSVSAIKHPELTNDGKFTIPDKERTKNKIRTMLGLCIKENVDFPVLGAFGCGAYGTPPHEMAKLFKEVLVEEGYIHCFPKVTFAIIDDKNAYREHNPEGNLKPFKDILEA